jgi:hypothetical protein
MFQYKYFKSNLIKIFSVMYFKLVFILFNVMIDTSNLLLENSLFLSLSNHIKEKKKKREVKYNSPAQNCHPFSICLPIFKNLQCAPTKFSKFSMSPFRLPYPSNHTKFATHASVSRSYFYASFSIFLPFTNF